MTGFYRSPWPHHPGGLCIHRIGGWHDVIKLNTYTPHWSRPRLDPNVNTNLMFGLQWEGIFSPEIHMLFNVLYKDFDEKTILLELTYSKKLSLLSVLISRWMQGCIWLCVINTSKLVSWGWFERLLGFQCFWAHRQMSLHGWFLLQRANDLAALLEMPA